VAKAGEVMASYNTEPLPLYDAKKLKDYLGLFIA